MKYYLFFLLILCCILFYYLFFLENYLYIQHDFLDINELNEIKKELKKISIFHENNEKKYCFLDITKNIKIYQIIYQNNKLKKYIYDHFHVNLKYPSKPIEYRIYKQNQESMGWHQDIQYIPEKYIECIFVLDNRCMCTFYYLKNAYVHSIIQKENDLILLKPKDLIHDISPIQNDSKEILKFIIELEEKENVCL